MSRERARFKNGAETFVVLYFIVRTARFFTPLLHPALRVSKHSLDGPAGTPSPKTGPLILCNLRNWGSGPSSCATPRTGGKLRVAVARLPLGPGSCWREIRAKKATGMQRLHKVSPWRRVLRCRGPGDAGRRLARHWPRRASSERRSRADLVALVQLLDQEGSFASPPRDFQSGPAGAGGGPAHEAIRPLSCAPALPRRYRRIDLSVIAFAQARLDEVAVADALKVVCAQQVRAPLLALLRLQPSAQKPFDIRSWACGVPTRHCVAERCCRCAQAERLPAVRWVFRIRKIVLLQPFGTNDTPAFFSTMGQCPVFSTMLVCLVPDFTGTHFISITSVCHCSACTKD